jgi:Zn finger protein HypA/HybF involved in hydrogenase expression
MQFSQLKFDKPVYTLCPNCAKKYDMAKWGVICPSCKGVKKIKKR